MLPAFYRLPQYNELDWELSFLSHLPQYKELDRVQPIFSRLPQYNNLYGMLPLIAGAPYALTEHLDRNPEKQLRRGKIGYLQSWFRDEKETSSVKDGYRVLTHLPVVVFINFPGAKWTLAPLTEPGLYPIRPRNKPWFLDKG